MHIAVVGTGYVGLVVGTCLADTGHEVICVDADEPKIARLRAGEVPIYEPGLAELIERGTREQRLSFTSQLVPAVARAQVVFIAVGTPPSATGDADLSAVLDVSREIGAALRSYTVVVCKSTVPVGTHVRVHAAIASVTKQPFDVVSNPEFLREGVAVGDFMRPDRVVIGTTSERARAVMTQLYAPYVAPERPLIFMGPASAELSKYAANTMLAMRISFINDIASLCERIGGDVEEVRRAVGADKRIGSSFLSAGVGYGGSCFPKDVKALAATARAAGATFPLAEAVERINERQKHWLVDRVRMHFGSRDLAGRRIALWGLAFKPSTDDLREAPSLTVIEGLVAAGAQVVAYDPVAMPAMQKLIGDCKGNLRYARSTYDAIDGADALLLVTEWNEFRQPDWARVAMLLRGKVIFDGRNLFDPVELGSRGFIYAGVGRLAASGCSPSLAMVGKS